MYAKRSIFQQIADGEKNTEHKNPKKDNKARALVRTPGTYSDVSITSAGIDRNQMWDEGLLYARGKRIPTNIAIFDRSTGYDLVEDLLSMLEEESKTFMATKVFAIRISGADLKSGPNDTSVVPHLRRMDPMVTRIRRLIVNIEIPEEFITSSEKFSGSSSRAVLGAIVEQIQKAQGLSNMSVVLILPKTVKATTAWEDYPIHYVFPFFPLKFKNWVIKYKLAGPGHKVVVANRDLDLIVTERHQAFVQV